MQHFFYAIHSFVNRRKFLSVALFTALLFSFLFFASRLQFSEDITNLIPSSDHSDTTAKVLKQMNFADKISIMVSAEKEGSAEDLSAYANEFLDSLDTSCKPYIGKIQGKIDESNIQQTFDFVYDNLPLFLDAKDYEQIKGKLRNDSIPKIVEQDYKSLISPAGMVSKDFILKDPLGISFIALKKLEQLNVGENFGLKDGFVITKDEKNLLLFITPKLAANETDQNTIFIQKLEHIRKSLNAKYSSKAAMTYFGATPVAVANATQIKSDVRNTSLFAVVTLVLILTFFYRSLTTPILIFVPSLFGAAFALAFLYFAKGSISAISLGISSILLGETTDYSIYVLTHLRNNRNVRLLYKDISRPLLLCGITTGISFLCLIFVQSEALKDLGIFAALSVVATTVFSLVLMPLLYKAKSKLHISKSNALDKLGTYQYQKNKVLLILVLIIITASFFTYSKVTFNSDLSALNFVPSDLKKAEKKLENLADGNSRSVYVAAYGHSYETVLEKNHLLFEMLESEKHNGRITNFSSIGGIVLSAHEQQKKIAQWQTFWNEAVKADVKTKLIAAGKAFGFKEQSFGAFYETLDKKFEPVAPKEYAEMPSLFLDEFAADRSGFYTISNIVKIPAENRDVFAAKIKQQSGLVLIDRQQTNETFLGSLRDNFQTLLDYSLLAITLILLIAFRRIELVIVTLIPVLVSWLVTSGIMGMFGLQFNIINIIVCTLIFGIGVDYSIFMTAGLQKELTYGRKELPTYKTSIILSVATTILGIGVLIFAHHPALKSIALIAMIGIFSALVMTFVLQPLVFAFFITDRIKTARAPHEIKRLLHSALSFAYYGIGGFVLSLLGALFVKVFPLPKKTKLKAFHFIFAKFSQSVLMTYPSVSRKIINNSNEKFEMPAVIIANHTCFLDILAIGMLSPKIIFLVSDWVYNSPIFGKGVRLAGFYPVSNGIDNGIEHLREKVEQGFSLMVFPEGTRSLDNTVKRFHKGAFYLAEKLQLDVVPVIIHGYSEVIPKGDFILNGGSTTVEILPRIARNESAFGKDYSERTKKISAYFKAQFEQRRNQLEEPRYFRKMIVNSFDYKEREIVRAMKLQLDQQLEIFHRINPLIGIKAKVLHISNSFGQFDLLLALQQPQRKITSLIADPDKRAVAQTNYLLLKRHIQYVPEVRQLAEQQFDVILINDIADEKSLETIAALSKKILLIGQRELKEQLIQLGFAITTAIENLTQFEKP